MAQSLLRPVALAHRAGLPLRLTELNSIGCGGRPGVSDTFATALWAPDALFELLKVGVDGVDLHVRATTINAPFIVSSGGLSARPLLYGLILFARALGPDGRLVATRLTEPSGSHLKAWAVRVRGGVLHVVLIDKGNRPARVALRLPAVGPASVERLVARSVGARSGVTLGGQWLGRDGTWKGRAHSESVAPGRRGYVVSVPATSAALVTVRLRPGALAGDRRAARRSRRA
jgi:hypothetical protein